jgi:AbrB family looped-hinge helix DNA binding protein
MKGDDHISMPLVRVKQKFQVTIPGNVRRQAGLEVGDLMEVTAKGNVIVLKPKVVVDRHPDIDARLREALEDVKAGRVSKTFHSVEELMADLNRTSKEKKRKAGKLRA